MQRHRASRLHYDFRLEIDGVLASWAVPKGPTLDPSQRRIAIHVEDHPLEYYDFEGVIPEGEYGGGDVIVWDAGTWEPSTPDDPGQALAKGELHLDLSGQKLRGRFVLVRGGFSRGGSGARSGRGSDDGGRDQWLLLHKRDQFAVPGWNPEDHPTSVLTGRTNDDVRADPQRLWRSDLPADQASVALRPRPGGAGARSVAAGPESSAEDLDEQLAALDAIGSAGRWTVFGRELRVSGLDREVYPARGRAAAVTKRELLRYTATVAPLVLPYLSGRRLTSSWSGRAAVPDWFADRVVTEAAALVWAVNAGAREWTVGPSLVDRPDEPTHAFLHVDPGGRRWADVLTVARLLRTAVEHVGLVARPLLTGLGGIDVWIPLGRGTSRARPTFARTRAWVGELAASIADVVPDLASGRGTVRIADDGNARDATIVVPYSPRVAPGAPVCAPVDWDELDDDKLRPDAVTIRNLSKRIDRLGDLFAPVLHSDQRLPRLR